MTSRAGGCLCGRVRYLAELEEDDLADYCHCRECRRASGAPVVAWVQLSPKRFAVTAGDPKAFTSSQLSTRWFCGDCGSQLYMTDAGDHSIGVCIATLDNPNSVQPKLHGWFSEHLSWFDTRDNLLRFPRHPPYDG
ncbi:MAG TPA: GFA family protein [Geminicoccus sp.]|uniref:GFA family protein n=1 Tax=Geminicoccus sp. TaxID=2024832 RepID=UPI002E35F67B|nr:GFA family protein [Geminicoccus sp.]HEX2526830.1 GFA family protein [Geminicoccus sp.]